jgi:hypothetical protein
MTKSTKCGKCEQIKLEIKDLKTILKNHKNDKWYQRIHEGKYKI